MKSIDLKSKVSSLETLADNIERLGTNVIQQAPIDFRQDEDTGDDYPFWGTVSTELNLLQREVIRQYQSWYTQAFELIKRYLSPDRSSEFSKYYSSGNITKTGIMNYLQFTCTATVKVGLH
jgi:HAMP domain-containing protein